MFSDLETDGLKTISLKKWREVKKLYENSKYQFEEMIMSYRLGNHAILPNILEYETPILSKLVYKFAYKNYLKLDNEKYQDLLSEMYTIFLNTLNKLVYNYSGQIVNYLYLSLQFRIQDYIKINYKKNLEFDESYIHASKKYMRCSNGKEKAHFKKRYSL